MYFKRIELHGFKSFAEPTVIEFDRGITCVVGPNGSGKSNICDAIRWVLGAQSAKALRGDKMEDVIFAGTASRKSRGMAEVTLVIDNSDGALDIDYNEVAVTRRMYRSGESEYLINNNICRMRDIRSLIMDTGIGVEGYSIIGQGKISDIISNNTESIREILEETAGIAMYRSRKGEAERKLTNVRQNMDRVNDIISEQESRIGTLKEDSEKASRYLVLKDRYRELEINITLRNIENIQARGKDTDFDLEKLRKDIDAAASEREKMTASIDAALKRRGELDERIEAKRAEESGVSEELNALTNKGEIDRQRLIAIERDNERLVEEIANLDEKIKSEQKDTESLFAEKKKWDTKLEELKAELDDKVMAHEGLTSRLAEIGTGIDDKKNELFNLQSVLQARRAEIQGTQNLKETLEKRKEQIESDRSKGMDDRSGSTAALEKAQGEKNAIEQNLAELKRGKEELRQKYDDAIRSERSLSADLEELKIKIGRQEARKRTFEEMEANYEGYNGAVKFIMKSGLKGLEGAVAELIEVPQGFEIAIETALGPAMQHIVTKDDEAAKRAVEELKANKAGRLTFLPLESIRPKGVKKDTPIEAARGFKGYGVTSLKTDEKYRPVIEYLLGNVVIMENMDDAVDISKRAGGGYKFVTLEGEVITAGGSITGGRHKHGSANFLERKAETAEIGKELERMREEQKTGEEKLETLRSEAENALRASGQKDDEIAACEHEFFAKENEITLIETAITDFESTSMRWKTELANIEREQKNSDENMASKKREADDAAKRIDELEKAVEEETALYDAEREGLENSADDITEARIALTGCESEKDRVDAIVKRIEDAVTEYQASRERKTEELEALKEEKKEIFLATGQSETELREKEEAMAKLKEELAQLFEEKTRIVAAYDEENAAREELEQKQLRLSNQKNEMDIRQARHETQLENAKNKLWDEFEISYAEACDLRSEDFVMSKAVKENREIKRELRDLGDVNVGAIEEYKSVSERYEFLTAQRADIEKSMSELIKIITDMDRIIRSRFQESFDQVVMNFESVYHDLHGGGHAKITLEDVNDPFNSEIEITAQPPGKQLKHINLLSGGEKTMAAIALMFAVLKTKPTPCCILDEVEAALDDSNLEVFGNYLREFDGVQFTLITHQKSTMEHADVMYGITMPESGVSKVYSLRMESEE